STKESLADTPDEELSVFVPDEEDLVLRSDNPDIFEGINDLAPGLHDMAVDRIVIAGADDALGAVYASAMAALVCNFDVIVLSELCESIISLAPGLHDMAVDRIVIAGADDALGAVYASAMAALVCNFDGSVLSDSTTDHDGEPVDWMDAAEEAGAMVKKTADTWLRM